MHDFILFAGMYNELDKSNMTYIENYKTADKRYIFPRHMIIEKPNCHVIGGGHMNVGENKKSKKYREIISTYWMNRIEGVAGNAALH